ncbi:MAG: tetratricopeptide repeat protein, partial [Planctomycetes bacterium]|nr:tetratricopeptide repeat protein [Planctomycetota bacterium]
LIAGLAPGLFLNREAHSGYFKMEPKPGRGKGHFYQVRGVGMKRHHARPPQANMYLNLLSNVGTIDWSATVAGHEFAEPKFFVDAKGKDFRNSRYRGEIFFADGLEANEAGVGKVRPNSILANVNVKQPGRLVINQNFHPAWRCDDGPVVNHNGLLAVDLANTGAYKLMLRYEPLASYFGLVVSALTLLTLALLAWLRNRLLAWTCAPMRAFTLGLQQAALVAILAVIVCMVFWFVKLRHDVAADYLFDYGNACTEHKRTDEAIKAFKKVIELKRDHPLVYRELGLCYAAKNRWVEAISQFRKGLEVSPGDTALRNLLSSACCAVERYEDAAREAQAVLDREPFNGRAHVNLAICHALEDRRDQALAALARAIEVGFTDHAYLERQPALKDILADESIALLIAQRRGSLLP